MTATTQRLNIKQEWQQVATGNATLIGCNTSASYHVHVGETMPTDKSAFITDKLTGGKDFNYNAPVWVKLNANNQIDEADLIVVGEAFVPVVTVEKSYIIVDNEIIVPIGGALPIRENFDFNQLFGLQVSCARLNKGGSDVSIINQPADLIFNLNKNSDGNILATSQVILADDKGINSAQYIWRDSTQKIIYMPESRNKYHFELFSSQSFTLSNVTFTVGTAVMAGGISQTDLLKRICDIPEDVTKITFKSDIAS